MNEKALKYLYDMVQAIEHVQQFMDGIEDYETFINDLKTQSAVERQLSIIGEAIIQYRKIDPSEMLSNTSQIAGLRNRLIHAYDTTEPAIIWAIIQNHLHPLLQEIKKILAGAKD